MCHGINFAHSMVVTVQNIQLDKPVTPFATATVCDTKGYHENALLRKNLCMRGLAVRLQ